jgi:hypothetical protein
LPGKNGFSVTKKTQTTTQQQRTATKNKKQEQKQKQQTNKKPNKTNKHPLKKSTRKPLLSKIAEIFQDIFYYDCILRLVNVKIFDNVLML